jgi:protein-S-isoprenylcysteine O-methyltransferase Ste14
VRLPSRGSLSSLGALPSLGPRGEGWVILQVGFIAAIALSPRQHWPSEVTALTWPLGMGLLLVGASLGALGILALGLYLTPFPRPRRGAELVERGVYGVIRNPIYAGLILAMLGLSLLATSVVGVLMAGAFALFLDLKVRREEQLLAAAFPGYEAYRRRTRRFVPGLY